MYFFLGGGTHSQKGYQYFDLVGHRWIVSSDVVFFKITPYYSSASDSLSPDIISIPSLYESVPRPMTPSDTDSLPANSLPQEKPFQVYDR